MLLRDILLCYVDVDAQRNPFKNTAVEKRDTENQHIKELHHQIFVNSHQFTLKFLYAVRIHFSNSSIKVNEKI